MKKFSKSLIIFFIIFVLSFFISKYYLQFILISGDSMKPTYSNNQLALLNKHFSEQDITQGSIVAVKSKKLNCTLIKRIVAVPGDTVCIKDHQLYINRQPYSPTLNYTQIQNDFPLIKLDSNEYFIMGDNCNNSIDSRNVNVGLIKFDSIYGIIYISTP